MDEVFKALADPSRRLLLDGLNARNGQTLRQLCEGLAMTRQAVSKHLAILEAANLVTTRRRGREKLHYLNAEPINAISDRWINRYDRGRIHALADLKTALESATMTNEFVYTTYIKTTPEQLWQALTDPAFTDRYWGATFDTDWRPGSEMVWHQGDWSSGDREQVVLESDPPRKLSYTWHTFDSAFADAMGMNPDDVAAWAAEPRSKVTFELEPQGEIVKLTVVHDGFGPGSGVLAGISEGWPGILANLKTLLETGEVLPEPKTPENA
ncbi:metalloregulator ArsR/SmtB family transcription factor [Nocardia sp. CDC159]|uniref:Metalloregulator ArsR/SmtB family transcription factor n=1 Tax=Nocardia pulmonis TaxID=2951408 RepID=A0A9X2E9D7_9NOCA|nr:MULTISPECIES: metalloregulator ArsR/SmtB family transcription factor [Nocardia]MCM6776537.1 metalloregulator ArsR/SmtB family transcription factor [Nocardia pulmonis]MCM6788961.1 metalloregulator ArsR/SmtB family transcription factor [Nocardia sp. CDC159]